jgi:predicted nuclease of predicted toxin-antitoxin system
MNFLADQDAYSATITFVRGLGYDAVTAAQLGLSQADDSELLCASQEQSRIFITRDRLLD